ncbi:MAG: phage portal protein [Rickettsiales bacterium]
MQIYKKIFFQFKNTFENIYKKTFNKKKLNPNINPNKNNSFFQEYLQHFINTETNYPFSLNISEEDIINNPVVAECLHYIANKVSNLPLTILRENLEEIDNDLLSKLLEKPNYEDTFSNIMYKISYDLLIKGSAFLYYNGEKGEEAEFYFLNANEVKKTTDEFGYIIKYNYRNLEVFVKDITQNKIPHAIINIKSEQQAKIPRLKNLIMLYNQIILSKSASLNLNARFGIIASYPNKLDEKTYNLTEAQLDAKLKSNKMQQGLLTVDGLSIAKWQQDKHNFDDLIQITELIQQLYGIPPQLIGGGEATHQGNMERFDKSLYESVIFPQCNNILSSINYFLNEIAINRLNEINLSNLKYVNNFQNNYQKLNKHNFKQLDNNEKNNLNLKEYKNLSNNNTKINNSIKYFDKIKNLNEKLPKISISINKNAIPIYSASNIEFMKGLNEITFLTEDEKRKLSGLPINAKLES